MGDEELSDLFERYSPLVLRRARAILCDPDEAKDAAQDVFVRAFFEGRGFEKRSQISTWLYRITTNVCLNRLRDARRRRALAADHFAGRPMTELPESDRRLLVREILSDADEQEASAAIFVYIDGMSHREAAEMLGVAKRTIRNLLERFDRRALERVEPQGANETRKAGGKR